MQRYPLVLLMLVLTVLPAGAEDGPSSSSPPPTLDVDVGFEVNNKARSLDELWAESFVRWETTNCDQVLLIGRSQTVLPPSGKEYLTGTWLLVAVGPGGQVSKLVVAGVKGVPGPRRWGVVYKPDDEFRLDDFLRNSQQYWFDASKDGNTCQRLIVGVLQNMGYSVGSASHPGLGAGCLMYTPSCRPHSLLVQSEEAHGQEGEMKFQVGFVIFLGRDKARPAPTYSLRILPNVQYNRPKQDKLWHPYADGPQFAIPACRALSQDINKACQ